MSAQASAGSLTRLALGTAQFGLQYGVANRSGQVSVAEVGQILARAAAANVDTLDTAIAYGTSESCLGAAGVASWRVISKLPPLPGEVDDVRAWCEGQVRGSLSRLGIGRLEGLLLHRPADLLGPRMLEYRAALDALQAAGLVGVVGVSIYDPAELDALWPVFRPGIVQAPCNVLDRRLIRSGWLARLADRGVRVHVRSVFLQGLLLMPATRRPAAFARWREVLDAWDEWCSQHSTSPLSAAIAFLNAQPGIERYVIGVDSLMQLEEVLAAAGASSEVPPQGLFCDDRELIEPARWKLT
ncbi:MAG TPA: aldo/keto reductase [Steroidobacteraceae bacterium]|jgi:hypothetical protein